MVATTYTRETGIQYKRFAPGHWQHVDCNEKRLAPVGPRYPTETQLLADHADYLRRAGWLVS